MAQHRLAIFGGGDLGKAFEDAAEIGGIPKAAAGGDVFELEMVMGEEMFGVGQADVSQVIDEGHVPVGVEETGKVVGGDPEVRGHGIARDIALVMVLEVDADPFECALGAALGPGLRRIIDESADAVDERLGEFGEGIRGLRRGLDLKESAQDERDGPG